MRKPLITTAVTINALLLASSAAAGAAGDGDGEIVLAGQRGPSVGAHHQLGLRP